MKRLLALAVCIGVFVSAGMAPVGATDQARINSHQTQPVEGGRLVYSARNCPGMEDYGEAECTFEIFTVALDGSEPQQLLSTFGTDDVFPDYSPDGSEIAFNSWDKVLGNDSHVWLMNADGSEPRIVTTRPMSWDEGFDWTPDGRIAFTRWELGPTGMGNDPGDIHILSRQGDVWSEEPLLTRPGSEYGPAFSPNGGRIAYVYTPVDAEQDDVWVSRADGTGHKRLTSTKLEEGSPDWSPDGTRIAFSRGSEDSYWGQDGWGQIWIMRADGSRERRLTPRGSLDLAPAWSPDGKRIAFTRCHPLGLNYDCGIALIDVARPRKVTMVADSEGYIESDPSWHPSQASR